MAGTAALRRIFTATIALCSVAGLAAAVANPTRLRATQPVPPQAFVIALPGIPDSAIELTRAAMRNAGDTPVDLTWHPNVALLSTKFIKNPRGPGTAVVMIAAEVARKQVATETWVRLRGWVMDSASTGRRDINGPIQNVAPTLNRTIALTPADSNEWAHLEWVVKGLEQLGGRVLRRP